jgi:hypothetical protein
MEELIIKPTVEEIKEFVEGPKPQKKKNENIWLIIPIGLIVIFGVIIALIISHNSGISGIENSDSVLNKTSGFTEAECNEICNISFPTRVQTTDCQKKICYVIGKQGALMDQNCLNLINEYHKSLKV